MGGGPSPPGRRRSGPRHLSPVHPVPAPIDPVYISRPEAVVFPTEDGLTAHAHFYAPTNPDYAAPEGE